MNILLQIIIILNGASLLYSIWNYARLRRAGKPLPSYLAGNITGTIGLTLMLISLLEAVKGQVETLLLIVGVVFTVCSITLFVRARRRDQAIVKH